MNDKDNIITKDVALAVIEEIVSKVPGLNLAYGLSKALFEAGLKLRQKRALEWVEMVRDAPGVFTKEILLTEEFQDGFAYSLEKYLIERSEEKRKIARNIFLGFTKAEDKQDFALEKFTHTLSQLSKVDIAVLKDVKVDEQGKNYQIYPINDPKDRTENIFNLIAQGLLLDATGTRIGYPQDAPFVKASSFGKKFIEYIKE